MGVQQVNFVDWSTVIILFLDNPDMGPDMDEWQTSKMELFPKPNPSIPSDISATTFQINNPIKV